LSHAKIDKEKGKSLLRILHKLFILSLYVWAGRPKRGTTGTGPCVYKPQSGGMQLHRKLRARSRSEQCGNNTGQSIMYAHDQHKPIFINNLAAFKMTD
jgi:hypothetical protein